QQIELIEAQSVQKIVDAGHVPVSQPGLDDMLELVAQKRLLVEQALDGRQREVYIQIRRETVEMVRADRPIHETLPVLRFMHREAGHYSERPPVERRRDRGFEVGAR